MKVSQVIKECRAEAARVGLTFARSNMNINGTPAYYFKDRKTGITVLSNCTIGSAYDNVCSGFIASYDTDSRSFSGIEF